MIENLLKSIRNVLVDWGSLLWMILGMITGWMLWGCVLAGGDKNAEQPNMAATENKSEALGGALGSGSVEAVNGMDADVEGSVANKSAEQPNTAATENKSGALGEALGGAPGSGTCSGGSVDAVGGIGEMDADVDDSVWDVSVSHSVVRGPSCASACLMMGCGAPGCVLACLVMGCGALSYASACLVMGCGAPGCASAWLVMESGAPGCASACLMMESGAPGCALACLMMESGVL